MLNIYQTRKRNIAKIIYFCNNYILLKYNLHDYIKVHQIDL